MKKIFATAIAALMLVACQPKQAVVTAGEFSEKAPSLVDQTIILKGTAVHVCQRSGMKLFLADSPEADNIVNVMAQEGQNKFDPETIGKQYTVKGIVRAVALEKEEEPQAVEAADSCAVADTCAVDTVAEEAIETGHECETENKAHAQDSDYFYYVENISYTIE